MKSFVKVILIITLTLSSIVNAGDLTPVESSKRIATVMRVLSEISEDDSIYKVKPSRSAKEMLYQVGVKSEDVYNREEFEANWTTNIGSAWETDSMHFAETTFSDALQYVEMIEEGTIEYEEENNQQGVYAAKVKKAVQAFKMLKGTGVMFGIAPMGAIKCGVRFAALVVLDPHSGRASLFVKEGSGC